MSAESTAQHAGRTIGSYRLEAEIGRGGMGVVYRATRLDTGETVALKLMLPEIAANSHFRQRFIREATLGSDLDHPNIVPIYDAGEASGELYIAMRLVEGRDLKSLIEDQGALEPKRTLAIMRQVASALDSAHEAGVVHHDIKPQNILISESELADRDLVYVTDFGLVRPAGSESTSSRTGAIFGSIQYMAPEQVEAMACDGRVDVYALGCVLYECLTGEIPFDRPNEVAVLWAHVHEQAARVTDRRPELAGGLDSVVATAMAKHPDDRYLTCGELVEELEKGLERKHRPVVMPVMRPLVKRIPRMKTEREVWAPNFFPELSRVKKVTDRVNWIQVTAVTAILCLLAAALVQFAHPRGLPGAVSDVAFAVGDSVLDAGEAIGSALTGERPGGSSEPRVSVVMPPDPKGEPPDRIGFAGPERQDAPSRTHKTDIRKAPVATLDRKDAGENAVQTAGGAEIVFDAPGAWWSNYSALYTMNEDGRRVRLLYNSSEADREPSWSPDGRRVAFVRGDAIYVIRSDGSGAKQVTYATGSSREPSWSPDGRYLVYAHAALGSNNWDLYAVEVAEDGLEVPIQITTGPASDRDPEWSPGGNSILFTRSDQERHRLFTINPDGTGGRRIASAPVGAEQAEWSPDGSRIVFVDSTGSIGVLHLRSSTMKRVACRGWCYEPSFSPNGDRLIFNSCKTGCDGAAIYSVALRSSGGGMRKLEDEVGPETEADWR